MLFKNIMLLDENLQARENQYVGILGEKIAYIGEEMPGEDFGEVYEGKGKLLMSGFFNAHAHTPMTLLRGYGENMALADWLNQRIFPFENQLTGEDIYYGTLLGIGEMLRYGTVSASDMYYCGEEMARAIEESGMKNNLSLGVVCFDDSDFRDLPRYHEIQQVYAAHNGGGNGRLKMDMCIHAEYTSTPKVVRQLAEYCKELGARVHIHLSETASEHDQCKERHQGQTPAAYFNAMGLFENPTLAAHCVWLDDEDFDILKEKGVTVASCPVSNLKLASGVCNVPRLLEMGIHVALGTDSAASNNNLNLMEDLKVFSIVHRGKYYDPTLITPEQALTAATKTGALAQGRSDTGSLQVGNRADLLVMDIDVPNMQPIHSLINNVVYAANGGDIVLTMVDGKVLYQNGEYRTIDMEKVVYQVEKSRRRILSQL